MANNKIIDLNALQEFLAKCDIRYQATLVSGTNIKTINNTTLLGSGNYAFDSEFSEVSTNALQNQVISKEIREINYELAVIRESLFETTLTEIDYEEQWATLYTIPETLTDNDGTHRLVYSETQLKMAKGNSVVVNQLARNNKFDDTTWWNSSSGTFSVNNNIATFTANAQYGNFNQTIYNLINGHKYLITANIKTASSTTSVALNLYKGANNQVFTQATTNWQTLFKIVDISSSGNGTLYVIDNRESGWDAIQVKDIDLIDLTQEFPINTPTSVDDVRVKWLIAQGYIPTNSGTLASTTISGVKIRGFNQWDEEWEVGSLDTISGANVYTTSQIRTKNYNKIKGGETYYCKNGGSGSIWALFYDVNNNVITGLSNSSVGAISQSNNAFQIENHTFTAPLNCCYIRFYLTVGYGTTYNYDICINVSNANLNGTYKPSVEYTISVPQTTLRSAGSVQDYLEIVEGDIVEGEQLYNVVKHVLVGSDDLGTLDWSYNATAQGWITTSISTLIKTPETNDTVPNLLSTYKSVSLNSGYGSSTLNIIYVSSAGNVGINNGSTTTQPTGTIYYELATPTTENIATNLHFDQVSALIEQGGTIEPIYTDVPCDLTTTFVVKKAVGE